MVPTQWSNLIFLNVFFCLFIVVVVVGGGGNTCPERVARRPRYPPPPSLRIINKCMRKKYLRSEEEEVEENIDVLPTSFIINFVKEFFPSFLSSIFAFDHLLFFFDVGCYVFALFVSLLLIDDDFSLSSCVLNIDLLLRLAGAATVTVDAKIDNEL